MDGAGSVRTGTLAATATGALGAALGEDVEQGDVLAEPRHQAVTAIAARWTARIPRLTGTPAHTAPRGPASSAASGRR